MRNLMKLWEAASEALPLGFPSSIDKKPVPNGGRSQSEPHSSRGRTLFQGDFFFCTVGNFADLPGSGCIYVETVVDRESGLAFAKVYPTRNASNAVDILTSRVVPFFDGQGVHVQEIHTRKSKEYCGHLFAHPYETFLTSSGIDHVPISLSGHPEDYYCERFYRFLLKEFFRPALRRKFQFSLGDLQQELDRFVAAYNAAQKNSEPRALKNDSRLP